ncbi:IS1 family transposase [Shinella sp.]|uniref:IS1 family transposase n=1 Tax=Shinella sp. TaxID=1870904 RepID=UPI003F72C656
MIWTAYSRRHRRVVAYHIGDQGVRSAMAIYALAKATVGQISTIFTDANSCYHLAFERIEADEPHRQTKAQTHLIESSNASFRDMLARFNRKTKRASETLEMLQITLDIFLARKRLASPT